jgi:signal transduction histidine kinase
VIKRNALVQVQLLDELADYSKFGANKLALTIRIVSLTQVIKAAVDALAPMASKKQIRVDVQLGLSEAEMDGDPNRLQQVFSNLFSNAIKFTPSGGNVTVTLESSADCHTLTVCDTGEGISADFLPFVFDRYRQADRTATGLGLGLTIARLIVELHAGTITAESRGKGEGAGFIVQLPRRINRQMAAAEVMMSPAEALSSKGPLVEVMARFDGDRPGLPVNDEDGVLQGYGGGEEGPPK